MRQAGTGVIEEDPEAPEAAKRPVGTAWRDGSHMTIPMTTMYELNPATGQVSPLYTCIADGTCACLGALSESLQHRLTSWVLA